jgi:hypothetical protein
MNIFSSLYDELPPLKQYLDYHLEKKKGNVIGSRKEDDSVGIRAPILSKLLSPVHS